MRATGSTLKKKKTSGRPKTVGTPVNVEAVSDSGRNPADNTSYDRESDEELQKTFQPLCQYPIISKVDVVFHKLVH